MGTIVLTKQSTTLFCYNSYHLAIKKKALAITHLRAFKVEEAGIFTMHRCPRATRPKEQEVTRWPVRVLSAVTTMMASPSDPCRGQGLVRHLPGGLKS